MGREARFQEFDWVSICRPRRLTIGDLMIGVVLAALGSALLAVTLQSSLSDDQRTGFGVFALFVLALTAAQRGLASIPGRRLRSGRLRSGLSTLVGIVAYLLAMLTYVGLFIGALLFPEGAALLVVTMLVLFIYLTTWD
jgi:hypothetical protein